MLRETLVMSLCETKIKTMDFLQSFIGKLLPL